VLFRSMSSSCSWWNEMARQALFRLFRPPACPSSRSASTRPVPWSMPRKPEPTTSPGEEALSRSAQKLQCGVGLCGLGLSGRPVD